MTVLVLSFDYDGCLYYNHDDIDKDIIAMNQSFLDKLVREIQDEGYEKVVIAIGSSRQSTVLEYNQKSRISAPDYAKIQSYLQAQFVVDNKKTVLVVLDPFRIVDTNIQLEIDGPKVGDSFQQTLQSIQNLRKKDPKKAMIMPEENTYLYDDFKISLVFAQIHRASSLHSPETKIVYKFYDDRDDIVIHLHNAFSGCQLPCPPNMRIEFHRRAPAREIEDEIYRTSIENGVETFSHCFTPFLLYYAIYSANRNREISNGDLNNLQGFTSKLMQENQKHCFRFVDEDLVGRIIKNFMDLINLIDADPKFQDHSYCPGYENYVTASELVRLKLLAPEHDHMKNNLSLNEKCLSVIPQKIEQLSHDRRDIVRSSRKYKIAAFNYILQEIQGSEHDDDASIKAVIMDCLKNGKAVERKHRFSRKTDPVSLRTHLAKKRFGLFDEKGSIADSLQIMLDLIDDEDMAEEIKTFQSTMN